MQHRLYAPVLDSVVANDFTHAGTRYTGGMPFPHKDLALNDVELRGLFLAQLIDFVAPDASVPHKPSASSKASTKRAS